MAWAQEIIDFILKLKPWTTVDEYQTGLYFWKGKVIKLRISEKKLIESLERRKSLDRDNKVKLDDKIRVLGIDEIRRLEDDANILYKKNKTVPLEWHVYRGGWKESWRGHKRLEHPERYNKNIPYGIYFHFPEVLDISRVVCMPCKEVVKDLKFVSVMVNSDGYSQLYKDSLIIEDKGRSLKPETHMLEEIVDTSKYNPRDFVSLFVSAFVKYQIEDGYKAFTNVQDWERSYHSQVLLNLSKNLRGTNLKDWLNKEFIEGIELKVKDYLNGPVVRDKWGIWTSEVGITDAVPHGLIRNVQELYAPDEGLKLNIIV